jgi:hypothetical protein
MSNEVIALIKQMANENSKWGAPRIHGELKNHSKEIISIDFLTVPTINFKLLHVLVIIEHHRRKLIYFNATRNPTAEWSLQQIRNLLFDYDTPKYLIRDRDKKYGKLLEGKKNSFGIDEIVTAYRSPWQNELISD